MTLLIEYENYIPKVSDAQYRELVEDIRVNGQREPGVSWNGVLLDGHHRYRACQELRIEFKHKSIDFPDRAAAEQWIYTNQVARRNLTQDQQIALAVRRGVKPPDRFRGFALVELAQELSPGALDKVIANARYTITRAHHAAYPKTRAKRARATVPTAVWTRPAAVEAPPPAPVAPAPTPPPPDAVATRTAKLDASREHRADNALADRVRTLEAQLDAISAPARKPLPPVRRVRSEGKREASAIVSLTDVHAGEVVAPTAANSNCYNRAICEARLDRFFAGAKWLVESNRSWATLDTLYLWLGGDLVTGHLHDELVETSEPAIQAMSWLEPILVAGIRELQTLATVNVIGSYGNHGRDTLKPRRSTGGLHSHEWGLYQRLANQLDCSVHAPPEAHQYFEVYGQTIHAHHGDEIKYSGGIGGIMIPVNKACAAWDQVRRSDYHMFAHYHQRINAGRVSVNGSLIGYNAYAMSIKAAPEVAQQDFWVLDAERGKTACFPIWVANEREDRALWGAK